MREWLGKGESASGGAPLKSSQRGRAPSSEQPVSARGAVHPIWFVKNTLLPPGPHKDFSYLYEKMSERGESAVLSPNEPRL